MARFISLVLAASTYAFSPIVADSFEMSFPLPPVARENSPAGKIPEMFVPSRAFSPREFVKSIKTRGMAPVVVDRVRYTVSFPTVLDGRLSEFDFALRLKSAQELKGSSFVTFKGGNAYASLLEIRERAAARAAYVAPSPVAIAPASDFSAIIAGIGADLWNPYPALSWSMDSADAHRVLRESPQPFSSISLNDSPDLIVFTDSQAILGCPADVELSFKKGQMDLITDTFTKPPNLQETIATYTELLGSPVEQKLVQWHTTRVSCAG